MLEPSGIVPWAGKVNAIAYTVWSLWMIAAGVQLWRMETRHSLA
jgi:hypothetical protein